MKAFTSILLALLSAQAFAQTATLDNLIETTLQNNRNIKEASLNIESQKQLKKTGVDLPKTQVSLLYGQYNSFANDNNITVTQTVPFTAFGTQAKLNRTMVASAELNKSITQNELIFQLRQTYYQLLYLQGRKKLLRAQDSIYEGFLKSASVRFRTGETNLLEQTTAETQRNEVKNQLRKIDSDISILETQIMTISNSDVIPQTANEKFTVIDDSVAADLSQYSSSPLLAYSRQQIEVARAEKKLESARLAPDLLLGAFTQTLIGTPNENGLPATSMRRFTGIQVGVAIPLWIAPYQGRAKAAAFNAQAAQSRFEQTEAVVRGQYQQALLQFESAKSSLQYYLTSALPNAELILKQSSGAFKNGEISYAEHLLGLRNALGIQDAYLQTVNEYNQSIIFLQYLTGNR